jgi:hypothetical protein
VVGEQVGWLDQVVVHADHDHVGRVHRAPSRNGRLRSLNYSSVNRTALSGRDGGGVGCPRTSPR